MRLDGFSIARTDITVAQCHRHAGATGRINCAERQGGGQVYEASWTTQPGWTWRRPFGEAPALDDEPAVHISFDEAQAFCPWSGGRWALRPAMAAGRLHRAARRPARVTQTPAAVNGLHDLGDNVWAWVDDPPGPTGPTGPSDRSERRSRRIAQLRRRDHLLECHAGRRSGGAHATGRLP